MFIIFSTLLTALLLSQKNKQDTQEHKGQAEDVIIGMLYEKNKNKGTSRHFFLYRD